MNAVLKPFRKEISWGGSRPAVADKKKRGRLPESQDSSAVGDKQKRARHSERTDSSAVGDEQERARLRERKECGKQRSVRLTEKKDCTKETSVSDAAIVLVRVPTGSRYQPRVESRSDFLSPCEADIGAHGVAGLRNRLRIQPPCSLLGGGAFGKVYRMSAVPWSVVGEVAPQTVAVKVMSKMEETKQEQAQLARHARREIDLLTMVAGSPGIIELLSWTEGLFDVHLAFPLYTEDLHSYTRRGALKVVQPGRSDEMPSICKQLLSGLSRLHELQILHRDVKPLNMLVHLSAVGDVEQTRAVLADLGGAIQISARVGFPAIPLGAQESEPTTYQYRAPELFVWKRCRLCSYPSDVWAMGVSIAQMDLGCVPFGRAQMQRSQMEDIFVDQLRVLYKKSPGSLDAQMRKDPTQFLQVLGALKLQEASCLPWGRSRGSVFQVFLRKFFFPSPESRPLARTLAQDKALSG